MEIGKIEEEVYSLRIFTTGDLKSEFIPWLLGDRGQQSFIKLKQKDEIAYLYSGVGTVLQAEVQKAVMRLVNEGWNTQGEVHVTFEGKSDLEKDELLERDSLSLELGAALLPLVDPYQGALLLERLTLIRDEIAQSLGIVVPSIKVRDNMRIQPNQYLIRLRESPVALGELYLERFLAIGSLEQLTPVPGWSFVEPTFKMNAKWIEMKDKNKAEEAGCMVQGALNVLITHLSEAIRSHARDILGLQETFHLLERLGNSYPVVVDDFLNDTKRLRKVRRIFQNLLSEDIPLRDMVTIMEVIGDNLEDISNTLLMTEHVRRALAHQICWPLLDNDGLIKVLVLNAELEKKLIHSLQDSLDGAYLCLDADQEKSLVGGIRKMLEEFSAPPIIITDPSLRIFLWNLLAGRIPFIKILSTAEIPPDVKISIAGEVDLKLSGKEEEVKGPARKKGRKFWKKEDK
jgi:flagellar biosynthesis protein FlhA